MESEENGQLQRGRAGPGVAGPLGTRSLYSRYHETLVTMSKTLEVLFVVGGEKKPWGTLWCLSFVHCHWENSVVWEKERRTQTL